MPTSALFGTSGDRAGGGAHAAGLWLVAPLGGPRLPAPVRVGFSLLLALMAAPALLATAGASALADLSVLAFALLLAREMLVGLCLGFVASAAFRAAEVAGRLGDTLRGANVAEILVPTADERASPLGVLYLLLATIVFLQIGGVPRLVEALLSSYRTLPIAGGLGEPAARLDQGRGDYGRPPGLRVGPGQVGRRLGAWPGRGRPSRAAPPGPPARRRAAPARRPRRPSAPRGRRGRRRASARPPR